MRLSPRTACIPLLGLLFLVGLSTGSPRATGQAEPGFQIIVHTSNSVPSLSKSEISALFLKRKKNWPHNGAPVDPVDLRGDSQIRENFSTEIHGRRATAVAAYWQRLIFQGRDVPPPTRSSEGEVVAFVQANPNAIGYVSRSHASRGVKVLTITE